MTLVQMQPCPTRPTPARPAVTDAVNTAGPRVCDDMTVEVALAVMAGAGTRHLLVCDNDDHCTGLVTRAQLTTVRSSPAYTDQLQLRDLSGPQRTVHLGQNFAPGRAPRPHESVAPPVPDEQDDTPDAPAPALALALALA
ncbi:CBS domain-containing protein [Streptomyces sp. NPDC003860]